MVHLAPRNDTSCCCDVANMASTQCIESTEESHLTNLPARASRDHLDSVLSFNQLASVATWEGAVNRLDRNLRSLDELDDGYATRYMAGLDATELQRNCLLRATSRQTVKGS